ncbi:MAG TPA: Rpp14/Pop5 family protein [Methanothrix sp.]|jgi:ribonuclease P/MRP protein subunit POP5|nr:ribonuclease P [Methanothrix sp.]HOV82410.1 Rpp14/Pop5 family protein [Methanothrix sp.]HPC90261.1 Rpp14/Pop5 family protein [Methanothrix sp.]HQE87990.1 Rpp14/Pop5 family protein [Methanothrix sp.]
MRSRLPVLRERRRYMAFEIEAEGEISSKELMGEIHSSQLSLFGDIGAGQNRLRLIFFDGRRGLLRFGHRREMETRASLASIRSVRGVRAALHTKGIAGTIKSAREKYLPRLSKVSAESDGRRIELKDVAGCIIRTHGVKVDICPDDRNVSMGSDTQFLGLTSFDLSGGHEDADGTADGL